MTYELRQAYSWFLQASQNVQISEVPSDFWDYYDSAQGTRLVLVILTEVRTVLSSLLLIMAFAHKYVLCLKFRISAACRKLTPPIGNTLLGLSLLRLGMQPIYSFELGKAGATYATESYAWKTRIVRYAPRYSEFKQEPDIISGELATFSEVLASVASLRYGSSSE